MKQAPIVSLEAIHDRLFWICHALLGMSGSLNDLNVIEASPLLIKIASGIFPLSLECRVAKKRQNKPR